jgi:AcrR family transcriptional regulator
MAGDRTAAPQGSASAARPLRADARRNRDRLLEVAARAFTDEGPGVTLEWIAKEAGVGIGTLYRHFPTREALIEAAHRSELGRLCEGVPELLREHPADVALRAWMDRVLGYLAAKHGLADALRAVISSDEGPAADADSPKAGGPSSPGGGQPSGSGRSSDDGRSAGDGRPPAGTRSPGTAAPPAARPFTESRQTLLDAVGSLLRAGVAEGVLRADVEPYDVLAALTGLSLVAGILEGPDRPARQLDLLLDGLRPRTQGL